MDQNEAQEQESHFSTSLTTVTVQTQNQPEQVGVGNETHGSQDIRPGPTSTSSVSSPTTNPVTVTPPSSTCSSSNENPSRNCASTQVMPNSSCTDLSRISEDELWLGEQRIPNESRLKFNLDRWNPTHPQIDVLFVFQDAKIGAHRLVLLDAPVHEFFRKRLIDKTGRMLTFIDIPSHLTLEGVEACLSYIYGKKINELGVDELNFEDFINAAIYFNMDVYLLPSLLKLDCGPNLARFISSNFNRFSKDSNFWKMDSKVILELCQDINPEALLHAFVSFMSTDQTITTLYVRKLGELQNFIEKGYVKPGHSTESSSDSPSPNCLQRESERTPSPPPQPHFPSLQPRIRRKRKLLMESSDEVEDDQPFRNHKPKTKIRAPNLATIPTVLPVTNRRNKQSKACGFNDSEQSTNCNSTDKALRTPEVLDDSLTQAQPAKRKYIAKKRKAKKPKENGSDQFFREQIQLLRNYAKKASDNYIYTNKELVDVKMTWKSLWMYMSQPSKLREIKTNCKRFLAHDGDGLVFDIKEAFSESPDFKELRQLSLAILATLARKEQFRQSVFTKKVVEYTLKELQSEEHENHTISTTAGEVLSSFLTSYGSDEWNIRPSRNSISKELRKALKRWDISTDRDADFEDHEIKDLVYLIEGNDRTANLYGLWNFTYFTSTDTANKNRIFLIHRYYTSLKDAHIDDILKTFEDENEDESIQHFAKELAKNLEKHPENCDLCKCQKERAKTD